MHTRFSKTRTHIFSSTIYFPLGSGFVLVLRNMSGKDLKDKRINSIKLAPGIFSSMRS